MRTLNITLENEEFEYLEKIKGEKESESWREFILELANYEA